jgi:hypothetical protein
MTSLNHFSLFPSFFSFFYWILSLFFCRFFWSLHSKENHFFRSQFFYFFSCKNTSHPSLKENTRFIFLIFSFSVWNLPFFESSHHFCIKQGFLNLLKDKKNSLTTLTTSIIFLNDTNCLDNINI